MSTWNEWQIKLTGLDVLTINPFAANYDSQFNQKFYSISPGISLGFVLQKPPFDQWNESTDGPLTDYIENQDPYSISGWYKCHIYSTHIKNLDTPENETEASNLDDGDPFISLANIPNFYPNYNGEYLIEAQSGTRLIKASQVSLKFPFPYYTDDQYIAVFLKMIDQNKVKLFVSQFDPNEGDESHFESDPNISPIYWRRDIVRIGVVHRVDSNAEIIYDHFRDEFSELLQNLVILEGKISEYNSQIL